MAGDESARRSLPAWVLILIAGAPLLVATLALQLVGPPHPPLSREELEIFKLNSTAAFLPGAITYAAMITIHAFACFAAFIFAGLLLRSVRGGKAFAAMGLALAGTIASLLLILSFVDALRVYSLSYYNVEDLYRQSGVGNWLLQDLPGLNLLGWATYLPAIVGIFAVGLMAAAATGQLSQLHDVVAASEQESEVELCLAHSRIKRCAYALSLVLVTSTVAVALFYQLPAKLLGSSEVAAVIAVRSRIEDYGAELTIFWGAVYSLTLFAAVGLPLLLVQKEVRDFLDDLKPPERAEPVRARMTQAGVISTGGEQAKMLIAFVAPLVSAPLASFFQTVAA